MIAAKEAVAGLENKAIGELKGFPSPPAGCNDVTKAIQILLGEFKKHDWGSAQQMMKDPNKFKERLEKYEKEKITPKMLELLDPVVK
jgi:dynein heavy chain, axonemal